MKGNANLCRAIVRAGARLGVTNNQGVNIFNYQVATKQLLFRLLGNMSRVSARRNNRKCLYASHNKLFHGCLLTCGHCLSFTYNIVLVHL